MHWHAHKVHDIPTAHLSGVTHPNADARDRAILGDADLAIGVDVVALAGYMKRLGPLVLSHYKGRLLNTHPALLPKFGGQGMYGKRVHEAVLAAGERTSGATVHLVEGDYDTGPVLSQVGGTRAGWRYARNPSRARPSCRAGALRRSTRTDRARRDPVGRHLTLESAQ